jgi:hypothetical protein
VGIPYRGTRPHAKSSIQLLIQLSISERGLNSWNTGAVTVGDLGFTFWQPDLKLTAERDLFLKDQA